MNKDVEKLFEYYNFEDWLAETSLAFVRESDAEKDFINVALINTNIDLGECFKEVESKTEEEQDYYKIIITFYAPLIMNYYVYKYYFNFKGTCNIEKNPIDDLKKLLKSKVKLNNIQALKKLRLADCGGC